MKIWKFLAGIQGLDWKRAAEQTKAGAESAKAVFDLAKTVKEKAPEAQSIKPFVEQIGSLLDVLNSPLGQIAKDAIPFAPIAVTILQLICEATKKESTLEQSVALVVQVAYLESVRSYLRSEEALLAEIGEKQVSEGVSRKIRDLAELEIDDREARRAILFFQESEMAKAFGAALEARLLEAGVNPTQVRTASDRIARGTNEAIQTTLAEMGEKINPLLKWYATGGKKKFEQYLSIEEYLRDVVSPDSRIPALRDRWRVFAEPFTLKEIYVPLEAQFIDRNGKPDKKRGQVVLAERAKAWLNDPAKAGTVLFIQGHPGRGKSAFCRMFADWVREEQHPTWTPVLIRLRDLLTLEKDFEETLRKAVDRDFAKSDAGWLSDRNTTFLFLLDGFDELLMQGRTSDGLEEFLEQVAKFQRSCQSNPEKGHRVLITGRTLALQSIERRMPSSLERVEIVEMDDEIQSRWFAKWLKLVGSEKTNAFQAFLQDEQCPERIQQLAREPLLLYLLAAMHRDGELDLERFAGAEGVQAKILVYENTIDWVLTKQRGEDLNDEITELDPESLRKILAEAGLSVIQAGGECAPLSLIEKRLEEDAEVKEAIAKARSRIKGNPLPNALATFYLQPGRTGSGSVEFIHKSFGEFLCAERLKEAIERWTEARGKRERDFYISTPQMNREIYDLLGSPVLSVEIVEYLMALLVRSPQFQPVALFERLHEFYERWCEGEFIDAPTENLPLSKMRTLKECLPEQEKPLGIRQVDVYAGLNVMILLLELHRYAQDKEELKEAIVFYPSGKPVEEGYTTRLLKIIGYSDCVELWRFSAIVGSFLTRANLDRANLDRANLTSANLDRANLTRANLTRANLDSANLTSANLTSANLDSANLDSANLTRANLTRANLARANLDSANLARAYLTSANLARAYLDSAYLDSANLTSANLTSANLDSANLDRAYLTRANLTRANLTRANLTRANLTRANLYRANLSNISWDEQTNWEGVQGLETAIDVPIELKQQLGLE
ncbi:MAG: pentapeptide repeat-containing protein [Phormidium tanganyikae FI6-MK23]|nr:pentapeptide repeat-containing protein [Phormidium tanganyikae FI6-MK23]